MTTPKRRILSFVFTVLCLKKSLLIRITIYPVEKQFWAKFLRVILGCFHQKAREFGGAGAQLRNILARS